MLEGDDTCSMSPHVSACINTRGERKRVALGCDNANFSLSNVFFLQPLIQCVSVLFQPPLMNTTAFFSPTFTPRKPHARESQTRNAWRLSANRGTTAQWEVPPLDKMRAVRAISTALEGPPIPLRWKWDTTPIPKKFIRKFLRKGKPSGALANRGR